MKPMTYGEDYIKLFTSLMRYNRSYSQAM